MTTLIKQYNSHGCVGRCDANCYNATTPRCTCICGGRNHGVGYRQARQNTLDMLKDKIKNDAGDTRTFLAQRPSTFF